MLSRLAVLGLTVLTSTVAYANPPVAVYVFPPGGQRGKAVDVRVGGLFLHEQCPWEVVGTGVKASPMLKRSPTIWFEGPILPLPDSQRQEDYPRDMAGTLSLSNDAAMGTRLLRMRTSQGVTASLPFVVGDLPEVVEQEIEGDPVPVEVTLPVTINGRIFPREDIDLWQFQATKGEHVHLEVFAARIGSPADLRLEILDEVGRRLAESEPARGADPAMTFLAPSTGRFLVRVQDSQFLGSQAHVYRLTLTRDPVVTSVFPLGAKRGQKVTLHLTGTNLRQKTLEIAVPADAPSPWIAPVPGLRFPLAGVPLDLEDHPEVLPPMQSSPVPLPAVFNGQIAKAGQVDDWAIKAAKGDSIELDLRAAKLGTRLIGVLSVLDSAGKVLGKAEANGTTDCQLRVTAPVEGTYTLRVHDRYPRRGGEGFGYRIKASVSPEPTFHLALANDSLTVLRKGNGKVKLQIDRVGMPKEAIELRFPGLPADVTVQPTKVNPGQASLDLTFTAKETAKIQHVAVAVVGVAKVAGKDIERTAVHRASTWQAPAVDKIALAIAMPTPFVIKGEYDMGFAARGGVHQRKYKIERNGYDGPLEILLADRQARHLQGVAGPNIVVPAGASEFTYAVQLPPWMETGRTCRVCVMGVGTVKDEAGQEHRVSFSSVNQNEQLVAVVGPGQLAMELDQSSGTLIAGQALTIGVKVKRGRGFEGPVRLELLAPSHLRMVTAEPTAIAKDQEAGVMKIRVAGAMPGILNMPLTVRAVVDHATGPIVAEAKLDLQPGR